MQLPDPKYKVKEGDTIQKLNKLFGINQDAWVRYHNKMAYRLDQYIGNELPSGLEEIYLMPALWAEADEFNYVAPVTPNGIQKPVNLHLLDELVYQPSNYCNRYGVVLHLKKSKVHYEIEFTYKGIVSEGIYQIAIDRKQVYVNDKKPSQKLYEMADQLSKAVYPLLLDINSEQKIEKIANHNEIVHRCKEAQMKLSQYYVGEKAREYFRLYQKHYENPNVLINNIENDLFYQLFTLPIHGSFENQQRKIQYDFVSSNDSASCNLVVTLDPAQEKSGKLTVRVISEEKQDTLPCFETEYRLHPGDHSIFWIRGHLCKKNDSQIPCRTDFEIYHLNPKESKTDKSGSFSLVEGELSESQKKKKSRFWDFFSG